MIKSVCICVWGGGKEMSFYEFFKIFMYGIFSIVKGGFASWGEGGFKIE